MDMNQGDGHLRPTVPGEAVPVGPALVSPAAPAATAPAEPVVQLPGPGERIGQYEIIRELGRGGMGAVYVARDTRLGRRVAIKLMQSQQRSDLTERFILEARATARCQHENIVVIHDAGEHRGSPYLVLEYLQGVPLTKYLGAPVPPGRVVELLLPVARALAFAHAQGIVHRDLKPDNVLLAESGTVKVLDFGLAKIVQASTSGRAPLGRDELARRALAEAAGTGTGSAAGGAGSLASPGLTQRGSIMGTIPYMAPEQWLGVDIDHRADLWAVGIMLFEMVTGRHPLPHLSGWQLGMNVSTLDEPMLAVRSVAPSVPDELASVIDRCLAKPVDARMPTAQALLDALEPLQPTRAARGLRADQRPYAGLGAFQEADAGRFFGRTRDIAAACARLRDQPLLGVVGASGVGKSSFVRAGVVPALKQSGEAWTSLVLRPGRQPLDALAHLAAPLLGSMSEDNEGGSTMADLGEHRMVRARLYAEPGFLGTVLRSRARHAGQSILLFIDQLEELYTLCDDERERLAFTACLASVADDATAPLRVVIAMRSDFLDRVAEDAHFLGELGKGLYFVRAPDRDGLREALLQPAELAGYRFEDPAMVEHMLDALERTPGALPLLQFAAARLWDLRDRDRRMLTGAAYHALGGITGALATHADAVMAELPGGSLALAKTLLLRLVTPERTRAMVTLDELSELVAQPDERAALSQLVDRLVHARLLVVQTGEGASATVELVHESLIHAWPWLVRWLDESHGDSVFLTELRQAARQWEARGRPGGLLWRGEPVEEARRWMRHYRGALTPLQQEFLQAAFALEERFARRRRWLVAGVIATLTIMMTAAIVALVLIRDAQKEAVAQAAVARQAEVRVREQLDRVQAEERARRVAEERERSAREAAERAGVQVEQTNEELARKNTELQAALSHATEARQRADASAAAAEQARADALGANEQLQRSLARERERVRRLENQGGATMAHDVDLGPQ
jgi:hypothetical protein